MSASNRVILIVLPVLALVGAFWFLLLAPKRDRAAELESDASALRSQVEEQDQLAATADAARKEFPDAYRRLVVLGKATPEEDDTSSLMVQLDRIAADSGVDFSLVESTPAGTGAAAPSPPPESTVPGEPAGEAQPAADSATPAPATEASAALLPIGAEVGAAGLPVMKWTLGFEGDFFDLADFVAGVDKMVKTDADGRVGIRGRLVTIDSFELTVPDDSIGPNPGLTAEFKITTFLTPAEEGSTGGASPSGPAPVTEPQPVSTEPAAPESATASATTP